MIASFSAGPDAVVRPPLQVFSARIAKGDPDRLDITRAGIGGKPDPVGVLFAPSERLLWPTKRAMEHADALEKQATDLFGALGVSRPEGLLAEAERLREQAWAAYVPAYVAEMRESYRAHRRAWDALLARPRVVLACFCVLTPIPAEQRCHRVLLRAVILPALGAEDKGEIGPAS